MTAEPRAVILVIDGGWPRGSSRNLVTLALGPPRPSPTLADHIAAVAATFSPATAGTYGCHWRLAIEQLGDRPLGEITVVDLQAVVAEAVRRTQQHRPGSPGRSSQETCIAALRALFARAVAAGIVAANPAAALAKPDGPAAAGGH